MRSAPFRRSKSPPAAARAAAGHSPHNPLAAAALLQRQLTDKALPTKLQGEDRVGTGRMRATSPDGVRHHRKFAHREPSGRQRSEGVVQTRDVQPIAVQIADGFQ